MKNKENIELIEQRNANSACLPGWHSSHQQCLLMKFCLPVRLIVTVTKNTKTQNKSNTYRGFSRLSVDFNLRQGNRKPGSTGPGATAQIGVVFTRVQITWPCILNPPKPQPTMAHLLLELLSQASAWLGEEQNPMRCRLVSHHPVEVES